MIIKNFDFFQCVVIKILHKYWCDENDNKCFQYYYDILMLIKYIYTIQKIEIIMNLVI